MATSGSRGIHGRKHALEELKRRFDQGLQNIASIDQKLQSLLSSASLIFSLASVVQVSQIIQSGHLFFVITMALALLFYMLMLVTILWGLRIISADEDQYLQPIHNDWSVLEGQYFDKSEHEVLKGAINSYLAAIEYIEGLIPRKRTNLTAAIGFFAAITFLIAISISVGASSPNSAPTSPSSTLTAIVTPSIVLTPTPIISPTITPTVAPLLSPTPF